MVLLEIDPSSLSFIKLKRYAPRAVDMNRIAWRLVAPQPMEVEAREIEVRWFHRRIESIEHQQRPHLKIRSNPAASALLEKLTQALVLPRPDHILM
jgi:hypothetical protein